MQLSDWREPDFPKMEQAVRSLWERGRFFERSLEQRRDGRPFVFYDGPPFATGLPHYGHLLAGTIKDVIPRYQTMRGAYVERRFGWDCHGLPVEYEVEQALGLSGKRDIEKFGVAKFNEQCRSIVLRHTREWREVVSRMGRWVDFDHEYRTMDPDYMESIWWVFQSLWQKDLIYEGNKILPYCSRCTTPLSNFETNQGYRDIQDPAVTVRLRLVDDPSTYLLVWTTTPWTLPSNMAVAVGREIPYVKVREGDTTYILARSRMPLYFKKKGAGSIVEPVAVDQLLGRRYVPLFPYFENRAASGAFRVIAADFVGADDGTGLVHMAPGFGEDDYRAGMEQGIPSVCPVDEEGRFTADVSDYAGREVKSSDGDIVRRLKQEGALVHQSTLVHSYPHCWRCDNPLIYRAVSTWFMKVEMLRERLTQLNRQVHWMPEHLRDGRFGNWLAQARDWAISRNRYWGTPLPLWRSPDGNEVVCIGSIAELEQRSGVKVTDLHKHYVDEIEIPSAQGGPPLRRVPEVLDCWFESGAMPYAQNHYPFENKTWFENHFPADFIAEGLDQTRGWFYTLAVLSAALFDRPAYRNVIVNGLVLAEDGRKMSKRLKNYPDPKKMLDTYGADAIRLYMMHSPVVHAADLRFSESGVRDILRHILLPLWHANTFFATYARIDGWTPDKRRSEVPQSGHVLDRWILAALQELARNVTEAMDHYDLQRAVRPFVGFVDDLTNWYIRRSRRRFWKSRNDDDKAAAYETLHAVLKQLSLIGAPFLPFFSEATYQGLRDDDDPESVHLCDYPTGMDATGDATLNRRMHAVMTVVRLGRLLRAEHNLKVRQPLPQLDVVTRDPDLQQGLRELDDLIMDELNVKTVHLRNDESGLASLAVKPDFRRLGPRLGRRVKQAVPVLAQWPQSSIHALLAGETVPLRVDTETVELTVDDVVIEHHPVDGVVVAVDDGLVVALHTQVDAELAEEGLARELVHHIQSLRKTLDLEVTQRIGLELQGDPDVRQAVEKHRDSVCSEVLAESLSWTDTPAEDASVCDLNGHACAIRLITPPSGKNSSGDRKTPSR